MFNNNYANNQMNGFGGVPQGTGYQFTGNQQNMKIQNNLSQEEIQQLVKSENSFSLMVTNQDKMRACCNHRWNNGQDAIVETADGKCKCQICQYEFIPLDAQVSPEVLEEYVANILDVLQTIKMLYINMPAESAREFFIIIPLIEKIPKLFEHAVKNYAKYDSFDPYKFNDRNMGTMALFNMLASALNNGTGFAMPQGQQMGFGANTGVPQQGMMGMENPAFAFGNLSNPMSNGFGYNGATVGYQPQTNNFQYDPNQQQMMPQNMNTQVQQPGQTAPENVQATTDGKTVDVNATFKA